MHFGMVDIYKVQEEFFILNSVLQSNSPLAIQLHLKFGLPPTCRLSMLRSRNSFQLERFINIDLRFFPVLCFYIDYRISVSMKPKIQKEEFVSWTLPELYTSIQYCAVNFLLRPTLMQILLSERTLFLYRLSWNQVYF